MSKTYRQLVCEKHRFFKVLISVLGPLFFLCVTLVDADKLCPVKPDS